jgi:hypothetical protein
MKVFLLTISLGSLLAVAVFGTLTDWDPYAMTIHGWIALGLCTLLSLGIGGALMGLVFHSAHKGYDDRIKVDVEPHENQE